LAAIVSHSLMRKLNRFSRAVAIGRLGQVGWGRKKNPIGPKLPLLLGLGEECMTW